MICPSLYLTDYYNGIVFLASKYYLITFELKLVYKKQLNYNNNCFNLDKLVENKISNRNNNTY